MRDYRFHCEDCDSYSQCRYYHNRKGTSLICKEFQHGSSVIEQIADEISQIADEETEHDKTWAKGLRYALHVINKYTNREAKMIEVDCRKCKNLGNDECLIYGKDADEAVEKCAKDRFKNYKKEDEDDE